MALSRSPARARAALAETPFSGRTGVTTVIVSRVESKTSTIVGRISPGPFTYCRVSTDDLKGKMASYVGQGRFTEDTLDTFGGYGVIEVPQFQKLLQFICRNGWEHHVAATKAEVADAIDDALSTYLEWDVYHHQ